MQSNQNLNAQTPRFSSTAKSVPGLGPVALTPAELKLVSGGKPRGFWEAEVQTDFVPKSTL